MKSFTEYHTIDEAYLKTSENGWWFNEAEIMETVPKEKPLVTQLLDNVDESCPSTKVVGSNVFDTYKTVAKTDVNDNSNIKNKSCNTTLHAYPFN